MPQACTQAMALAMKMSPPASESAPGAKSISVRAASCDGLPGGVMYVPARVGLGVGEGSYMPHELGCVDQWQKKGWAVRVWRERRRRGKKRGQRRLKLLRVLIDFADVPAAPLAEWLRTRSSAAHTVPTHHTSIACRDPASLTSTHLTPTALVD